MKSKYIYIVGSLALSVIALYFLPLSKFERIDGEEEMVEVSVEKKEDSENTILIDSAGGKKEMVQIKFSWVVDGVVYSDAIVLPKDQYEKTSPEEIEKMKEERIKNWVENINRSSVTQ